MVDNNTRYQSDLRSSTFNLHSLFTRFVDDFGKEGFINLLDNASLTSKFVVGGDPLWPSWDYSSLTSFSQPDERFFLVKSAADSNEKLQQEVTSKVLPGRTYTVIFKGVIESNCIIDVVGGPLDIMNPDDLSETGSSSVSITGSVNQIYSVIRFNTADTISGTPIYFRIRPSTVNTYIRIDKLILKEGWLEVNDLFTKTLLDESVRYNEVTSVWEITGDGGATWAQFGNVGGETDVAAVVGSMVTGGTENGIVVTYTSGNQKLNFDVNDFILTFDGDVSGSGTITNLSNQTITITVANDSHLHTVSTISDFVSASDAKITDRIDDLGVGITDLWSASKLITSLAGKEPTITHATGFNKNFGTSADTVSEGNHTHQAGAITNGNTAYNKNFGTSADTVAEGNHTHALTSVLTGTVAHGGTIPLPVGYTQEQCNWMVSINSLNTPDSTGNPNLICSANASRVVTVSAEVAGTFTYGTANYMIIGVK